MSGSRIRRTNGLDGTMALAEQRMGFSVRRHAAALRREFMQMVTLSQAALELLRQCLETGDALA